MRIVYYIPQLGLGGTEHQLLHLVSGLDRGLYQPLVWCPGRWGPVADRLLQTGVPVHRLPLNPSDPRSLEQAVAWLRSLRARIFHSFGSGWEWFDTLVARLAGIPVCMTSRRNMRHWDPDGKVHLWQHIRNLGADLVIANSRTVAAFWARREGTPPEKVRVIYNGVPMPAGRPQPESPGPVIGNVANLRPVKGQVFLLEAFRQVVAQAPQSRLLICGEGAALAELEQQRDRLGLRERVRFLGSRQDVEAVYRSLDLYVHSSLSEGMPNAVLEAMSHGLPVVATSAGGTPEAVVEGITGLLAIPGDPDSLAGALLRALPNEPLRRLMGAAARQRIASRFSVARMVGEYEAVYRQCAGGL